MELKQIIDILYWIRCVTGSQSRVLRIGWMWSHFLAVHTSLAAAVWTFWSLSSKYWEQQKRCNGSVKDSSQWAPTREELLLRSLNLIAQEKLNTSADSRMQIHGAGLTCHNKPSWPCHTSLEETTTASCGRRHFLETGKAFTWYFDGNLPPYLSCRLSSYTPSWLLRSSSRKRLTVHARRVSLKNAGVCP